MNVQNEQREHGGLAESVEHLRPSRQAHRCKTRQEEQDEQNQRAYRGKQQLVEE
jgi:hypothetical protein